MANVSSSNGLEKRPRLSFQQADGSYFPNWTSASLGSIILPYSEKVYGEHSYEVLTSSREGLQRQSDHFATEQRHDTDGYNVIPFGYCTYRNRSDDGKFTFNMNKISENGIVSKFYPVFSFENANSEFMIEYLNSSENIKKKLSVLAVGTSQVVLSFEALKKAQFPIPCKAEQDRIAALLECINRRIVAQSKIVDSLKKYKRGLSDSLFARISQSPGCKIVKLGDAFELLQNNTFSREDLTSELSTVQNIHYGDVLIKYGAIVNIAEDKPPYIKPDIELKKFSSTSYLCDGDIVFADTAEDYNVGKATEIAGANGLSVLSGLHTIPCRPLIKFHPMYLGYYFNSSLFRIQIYPLVQGTKVSSISKGELVKASVYVPALEVQKRIALLLYSMDCRIAMEERKNSALITARAALLQQLFI